METEPALITDFIERGQEHLWKIESGLLELSCHAFKLGISSNQDDRTTRIL